MWWSKTAQRHEVPTAVLRNLAAVRRRTVTVCYVQLCRTPYIILYSLPKIKDNGILASIFSVLYAQSEK